MSEQVEIIPKVELPRDKNGQFIKKVIPKPEPEPETPKDPQIEPEITPKKVVDDGSLQTMKQIITDMDTELKTKLGDKVYNEFKDYPVEQRVKLLKAVDKTVSEMGTDRGAKANKGANPPPAITDEKPGILERNNAKLFFKDLKSLSSYKGISERLRGKTK